jgi:hypothetical protein
MSARSRSGVTVTRTMREGWGSPRRRRARRAQRGAQRCVPAPWPPRGRRRGPVRHRCRPARPVSPGHVRSRRTTLAEGHRPWAGRGERDVTRGRLAIGRVACNVSDTHRRRTGRCLLPWCPPPRLPTRSVIPGGPPVDPARHDPLLSRGAGRGACAPFVSPCPPARCRIATLRRSCTASWDGDSFVAGDDSLSARLEPAGACSAIGHLSPVARRSRPASLVLGGSP